MLAGKGEPKEVGNSTLPVINEVIVEPSCSSRDVLSSVSPGKFLAPFDLPLMSSGIFLALLNIFSLGSLSLLPRRTQLYGSYTKGKN